MPWSLRAASCLTCSSCASTSASGAAASGAAASSAGAASGGAASSWAAAALRCADFSPMLAAVPATTAVVATRAMGRRRRIGMSNRLLFSWRRRRGPFGANGVGLPLSGEGVLQGAHGLFDELARDSCAFEDYSVCIAHCGCERGRPGVLPDEQRCRSIRLEAQSGVGDVFVGENPAHLGVEAGERRQLRDSIVLDHLHVADGIFRDESEVDDPHQSAVYELGE